MQILKYLTVAMLAATTFSVTAAPAEAFSLKRTIRQVIAGNGYDPNCGYGYYGNGYGNQYNSQYGNYFNGYNYSGGNRSTVSRLVNRFIGGW